MKVLFIIERYNEGGGATLALLSYIHNNKEISDYCIVCKEIYKKYDSEVNLKEGDEYCIHEEITSKDYSLIHFFRAGGADYFRQTIEFLISKGVNLPVIITVCQKPSYDGLWLTPYEIRHSDMLVFLDKAAYDDKMYRFISSNNKRMIYFGFDDQMMNITENMLKDYHPLSKTVVYGRGSSLNKCPSDMFDVFDKITTPKSFVIVGNGSKAKVDWISKQSECRNYTIKLIEGKPLIEWLKILNSFDVFLYYLPADIYSSLDATLRQAMLLEKPVVFCGPEAPKEGLYHGENALIAKSAKDIPHLCEQLYHDKDLRRKLGKNARKSTIEILSLKLTIDQYNDLMKEMLSSRRCNHMPNVPLSFYVKYYSKRVVLYLKRKIV